MSVAGSASRSPSGQWYPQQQQQQQQMYNNSWTPSGTPPTTPGGAAFPAYGYNQQQQMMGGGGGAGGNGGSGSSSPPNTSGYAGGNMMMGGNGAYPMGQQQQSCCDCCGQQQSGCCGGPQGGGCCPMPGEPLDPYVCQGTPGNPPCHECLYSCFDYTFAMMCLMFVLSVVGFGVVLGTSSIDDLYKEFDVTTAAELDVAMRPYIVWLNPNITDNETNSSSSDSSDATAKPVESSSHSDKKSGSHGEGGEDGEGPKPPALQDVDALLQQAFHGANAIDRAEADNFAAAAAAAESKDSKDKEEHSTTDPGDWQSINTDNGTRHNITHNCTRRNLLGSFGSICMEDNLNANVFAVQLSHWNNARDTLWFLAMVFTGIAIILAVLIHVQRNPTNMMGMGMMMNPSMLPPEKQAELMKLSPQQQQAFMAEYQQDVMTGQAPPPMANPAMMAQMMNMQQQQGCGGRGTLAVYETPYYEFLRFAWGFVGLTVFTWTCNLCLSFWAFSSFYVDGTTGPLREFWKVYAGKFSGSIVMITIYLAWPLCNIGLDLVVWLLGIIPWVIIRSTCKPNIGNYRPNLPLSELPGWIRCDMFFMDFADLKRLGFSRQAWLILTGTDRPFFDTCCLDPMVDTDPAMTALLAQRYQWEMQMYTMMPPWARGMMPPPMPPPGLQMSPEQQQQQMMAMMGNQQEQQQQQQQQHEALTPHDGGFHPPEQGNSTPEENGNASGRRHRKRRGDEQSVEAGQSPGGRSASRARRHRSHADPLGASAADEAGTPRRRRHRSRSLSQGAVGGSGGALSAAPAAGAEGGSRSRRRRRSRSVSKEVGIPAATTPLADGAAAGEGEGKSRRHRSKRTEDKEERGASRSHRSRSRSMGKKKDKKDKKDKKEKKEKVPAADLDALMQL